MQSFVFLYGTSGKAPMSAAFTALLYKQFNTMFGLFSADFRTITRHEEQKFPDLHAQKNGTEISRFSV